MQHKWEKGDCARLQAEVEGQIVYGTVRHFDKESGKWLVYVDDADEPQLYSEDEMSFVPELAMTEEIIRKLLRYEMNYAELINIIGSVVNWERYDDYQFTLEDMIALLENLQRAQPTAQELSDWQDMVFYEMDACIYGDPCVEYLGGAPSLLRTPKNDAAMAMCIYATIDALYSSQAERNMTLAELINIPLILEDIEHFRAGEAIIQHRWSLGNKLAAIRKVNDVQLMLLDDANKAELRALLLELSNADVPLAIDKLGYSYYGGNALFPCDWQRARDCFLRLMDLDSVSDLEKCQYANTLGYIFYYGRCTDGVPEYDKAYQYYALSAAGGIYQAMYKLADMYMNGYYVKKNTRAAETLVSMAYNANLELIQNRKFDCQFADAALRMGKLCRDGVLNAEELYFLHQAECAIRKRMVYDHYGDNRVFSAIQNELARAREKRPLKEDGNILGFYAQPQVLEDLLDGHTCAVKLTRVEGGIVISVKRMPQPKKERTELVFECYPMKGYCQLTDKVTLMVHGAKLPSGKKEMLFVADCLEQQWEAGKKRYAFLHHGEECFALKAEEFVRILPSQEDIESEMRLFASVVFDTNDKTYDYICEIDDISVGDTVVVHANGEDKEVRVVRVFKAAMDDMPLPFERYKTILRKA